MANRYFLSDEHIAEMFPDPRAFARAKPMYQAMDARYQAWKQSLLEPATTHDEWVALAADVPSDILRQEHYRRVALALIDNMPDDVLTAELQKRDLAFSATAPRQSV